MIPKHKGSGFTAINVSNISPYIIEGNDICVLKRTKPISSAPSISFGNMANDGGHLILSVQERNELIEREPSLARFVRRFIGADELITDNLRYCLWLEGATPRDLANSFVRERIAGVKAYRLKSDRKTTRRLANFPSLFGEIRQPEGEYLAIPKTSSETRKYIPVRVLPPTIIAATEALCIGRFSTYDLGIVTSSMHMAWVRLVAGRLESRYRYSNTLVYNNFPWPQKAKPAQVARVEELAQSVLDARALYPDANLAQLYDPTLMPPELVRAHERLDRAVERCYRSEPFTSDRERVEFLFALYEQLTAPLLPTPTRPRRRRAAIERTQG